MKSTTKQVAYISYMLKANKTEYPRLEELFPTKIIEGGKSDISYIHLEGQILQEIDLASASNIISMLKDDLIIEGFNQLHYLLNN